MQHIHQKNKSRRQVATDHLREVDANTKTDERRIQHYWNLAKQAEQRNDASAQRKAEHSMEGARLELETHTSQARITHAMKELANDAPRDQDASQTRIMTREACRNMARNFKRLRHTAFAGRGLADGEDRVLEVLRFLRDLGRDLLLAVMFPIMLSAELFFRGDRRIRHSMERRKQQDDKDRER